MINLTTHAIAEFRVPTANAYPKGIVAGPDGNLWFVENEASQFGMINPTTHAISEFPSGPQAEYIAAGPDGNLWYGEPLHGNIGEFNLATHDFTDYAVPYANSTPLGITAGPDGNVWFTDQKTSSIGVATVNQTAITQLVVTQQPPANLTAGSGFGLTVQAEDSSGNLITSFNGTVTVGLASNPGGTTLGGTLTVAASGGVASFSGLTLTKVASGYTIYVSGSGPIPTTTSTITVTPAAATQLVITQQPPGTVKVSTPFGTQASIEDVVTERSDDRLRHRERCDRQRSELRDPGRHADSDRVGRCGELHQPDDQQDRLRLHAPGLQHGAHLGHE